MRVPRSQENISGKDLTEQSGENWVPARAQSGHESEEQSDAGQAVYRAYILKRESAAECQKGVKWLRGVPGSQKSVE